MREQAVADFQDELRAQGVPSREDAAFRCPLCGTVQSMRLLLSVGAGAATEDVEGYIGFSCVGRWTSAGPAAKGRPGSGKTGCDWTLGGLLRLHELEVITDDGRRHATFVPATPAEAQALAAQLALGAAS